MNNNGNPYRHLYLRNKHLRVNNFNFNYIEDILTLKAFVLISVQIITQLKTIYETVNRKQINLSSYNLLKFQTNFGLKKP